MREVNFLPSWYPKVIRQKKLLTGQVWATAIIVAGGVGILASMQWKTAVVHTQLAVSQTNAQETIKEVHELDEMLDLQRQLVAKQSIVNELGLPVELSRLIAEMGSCAPREVAFTGLDATTIEEAPQTIAEKAMAAASGKSGVSRHLELHLRGVAPTEAEVTTFWSHLIERPYMTHVRLVNSNERIEGDHKMREFEITFDVSLDAQQEGM